MNSLTPEIKLIEKFISHLGFAAPSLEKDELDSFVEFEGYCFSPSVFEEILDDFLENEVDFEEIGATMEEVKEILLSHSTNN